ncbi:plasmid-partitioning protein SopA, partial [Yersinia pestis]|nr:plasmid-partitioning protein SopA [Yersinia pestis]
AELYDFVSTLHFFTMVRVLMSIIDLNCFEPDVRVLITNFSNAIGSQSQWMDDQIRTAGGGMVLKEVVRVTDEVGTG